MSKLEAALKKINKDYDDQIAFEGNEVEFFIYDLIPFSSPRLNYMLYGGLPMGRMVEFAGPDKSGKTTTAFDIIKQAQIKFQKEFNESKKADKVLRKVCFVDAENTFDAKWATTLGVNVNDIILIRPQGEYAEQIFEIMKTIIETGEIGLIVLDSVAQLVGKQASEKTIEEKTYGGIAMALTKYCNVIVPLLSRYNCMNIMINQVRDDLSSQYNEFITPGGRGFKHNCTVRLMFRQGSFIDVNNKELTRGCENPAGNLVQVKIEKTKSCRPDRRVGYYTLKYLEGIDYLSDTIDVLIQLGIIVQRGAYYDINDINDETGEVTLIDKFQGKTALMNRLKEDKELFEKLYSKISYN